MAEPDRNGLGDGRDNYAGTAQNIGQALRQANSAVHIAKTGDDRNPMLWVMVGTGAMAVMLSAAFLLLRKRR